MFYAFQENISRENEVVTSPSQVALLDRLVLDAGPELDHWLRVRLRSNVYVFSEIRTFRPDF